MVLQCTFCGEHLLWLLGGLALFAQSFVEILEDCADVEAFYLMLLLLVGEMAFLALRQDGLVNFLKVDGWIRLLG